MECAFCAYSLLCCCLPLASPFPKGDGRNAVVGGKVCMVESEGCVVHVSADKKILIQGLKDYIVAEQDNVILICRKADEQRIKEFSTQLR